MQICLGLQTAQDKFKLAHNDLHLKNILIQGLDPLTNAMRDLGLSLPSKSGVNVYYPYFTMTVYTSNIPVIIDFGKSRLEVSERLQNAMEANSEADILAALNNPQKGEPTVPINATDELVTDVHWGGYYGYTHKFNSANDIFMVVEQVADMFRGHSATKPNPLSALTGRIESRMTGVTEFITENDFTYEYFEEAPIDLKISSFGGQFRLPVVPGPNFLSDQDDHTVQDLNGLRPIDVVQYIADLYPREYALHHGEPHGTAGTRRTAPAEVPEPFV